MSSILTPLHPERLYLFTFGPSFGETLLLRVPPDHWTVIDSFRINDNAAAQQVLEAYRQAADLLILTHPHHDHVCGFVDLIDDNNDAKIGCVTPRDIARSHPATNDPLSKFGNNAKKTYVRIEQEHEQNPDRIWRTIRGEVFSIPDGRILCLHPKLPIAPQYLQSTGCNEMSSPMLVDWKGVRLLLGADLTNIHDHWNEIAAVYPQIAGHVAAKVPHHGSREALAESFGNGPRNRCWVATPYNKGSEKLPRFDNTQGVQLIHGFVGELLLTSLPYRHEAEIAAPLAITRDSANSGVPARVINAPRVNELERGIVLGFDADGTLSELRFGQGTLRIRP